MDLGVSDKVKPILAEVKQFIDTEILPLEAAFFAEVNKGDRWSHTERQLEILEGLKARARAKNLWNFFLTHWEGGYGLNTVEYAYIAEETGRSHLAPEVFNCSAPDTGNMAVLSRMWPPLMPPILPCPVSPMVMSGCSMAKRSGSPEPVIPAAKS